jgi:translation initiation factor 2 subunit 1
MPEMPESDELVIVRIKKIMPYGAFCELEEYPGREAFLHISEVASRWIKNIHEFVKEGQRTVGRVYRIVPEKNLIDISLKRVTEADQKRKLESFNRDKRASKLIEVVKTRVKKTKAKPEEIEKVLLEKYGEIYAALEEAASNEEEFRKLEIPKEWQDALVEIAKENIKKPVRRISGVMNIQVPTSNGIEIIKGALTSRGAEIHYLGAPSYMISVEGDDFKKCEKKLRTEVDEITKVIAAGGGTCKFERKE